MESTDKRNAPKGKLNCSGSTAWSELGPKHVRGTVAEPAEDLSSLSQTFPSSCPPSLSLDGHFRDSETVGEVFVHPFYPTFLTVLSLLPCGVGVACLLISFRWS